jgi:hypothetical protein
LYLYIESERETNGIQDEEEREMAKVNFSVENRIGFIEIDNPPVNALDQEVLNELSVLLDNISSEIDVIIMKQSCSVKYAKHKIKMKVSQLS